MQLHRLLPLAAVALSAPVLAQNDISWAEFAQDNARLIGPAETALQDQQEKDYAVADLNRDGWVDLVVARKRAWELSAGKRANVLFLNEAGVLADRTALYASASDVPGDQGFLTPTRDRDVVAVDVDGDGWLDVVTATSSEDVDPKHISHPRVYLNLGADSQGNWLGLEHQDARIPQLTVGVGGNAAPYLIAVAAGDVTGDGYADLYFTARDEIGQPDEDDHLLINDGNGFFTDESQLRMTTAMLEASYGTAAQIADMNGNGVADILRCATSGQTAAVPAVQVSYNNPGNEGFFNILQVADDGTPYHVAAGDLNADGDFDLFVVDDLVDEYLLNEGNDGLGRVIWSVPDTVNADDGYGGNITFADLDNDGWNDVITSDIDAQLVGCSRRMHIRHNRGGTVGGAVNLREEQGSGFVGATGFTASAVAGTFDVAALDIDNDGDQDLVVGHCFGTDVWLNQLDGVPPTLGTRYCGPAQASSSGRPGSIAATGTAQAETNGFFLTASSLPAGQFGYFLVSATQGFVQNPAGSQGNLCVAGTIGRFNQQIQNSGADGAFAIHVDLTGLPIPIGQAVQAGDTWNFTCWYRDFNPGPTSNLTDGAAVTFQ